MKNIIQKSLANAYTYHAYINLVDQLLLQGKSTGPNQSEDLTHYSMLNQKRMQRLDKTIQLKDETIAFFQAISTQQTWLVITEGWCGDAAQNLPIIQKMAATNPNIQLKLVLRDENVELMDLFLTNNSRSIPKLIGLDNDLNILFTWGPRPSIAAQMVANYKKEHGALDADFKTQLQLWYTKNKGENLQEDFLALVSSKQTIEI